MSNNEHSKAPLRKFRMTVVRLSLILTFVASAIAYPYDPLITQGMLLGGIGGILAFWMMARSLEKLATVEPSKVKFAVLTWSVYRFVLYAAVLGKAYTLDKETMHGLLAAVAGILFTRIVLMFLGFTGIDLKADRPEDQEDQQH